MGTKYIDKECIICTDTFNASVNGRVHCRGCVNRLRAVKKNGHLSETHPSLFSEIVFSHNRSNGVPYELIHPKLTQDLVWKCALCDGEYKTSPGARVGSNRSCGRQECVNFLISSKRRKRASAAR